MGTSALLTSVTNAVRSRVAGRINSALFADSGVGTNAKIRGGVTEADTKHKTDIMSYPSNVDSDPQQGQYILFNLNEFEPGELKVVNKELDYDEFRQRTDSDYQLTQGQDDGAEDIAMTPSPPTGRGGRAGGSILAQKPTTRLKAVIALYMPPSVSVAYNVKYAEAEIGTLAMLGKDAVEAFMANKGNTESKLKAAADAMGPGSKEGFTNLLNASLDTLAPGARALQQIESGKVITPRMEIMFENVGRRDFSYTFNFIPKSADEARTIEKIIYTFKHHMMPKYSNPETRREMDIPGTFDITYMYQTTPNAFINKISSCFLKDVEVQYGAERYTAYEPTTSRDGSLSPPPQKSQLVLNFTELETLSKEMIQQGY